MIAAPTHADASAMAAYTGKLVHNAEVRQQAIDNQGHMVPVLVIDIETDAPLRLPLHIVYPFTHGQMHECEAAAKHYKKGQRITVYAPVLRHRLAVVASHIQADPTATHTTPSTTHQETLL